MKLLEWKLLRYLARPYGPQLNYRQSFAVDKNGRVFFSQVDIVSDCNAMAKKFVANGLVTADEHGNFRLNDAGLSLAENTPEPKWNPPPPPKLADADLSVLAELEYASRNGEWASPLDCGGRNGSHHSASLTKLVRHGYAECWMAGKVVAGSGIVVCPHLAPRPKGSRKFRITDEGKRFIQQEKPI